MYQDLILTDMKKDLEKSNAALKEQRIENEVLQKTIQKMKDDSQYMNKKLAWYRKVVQELKGK